MSNAIPSQVVSFTEASRIVREHAREHAEWLAQGAAPSGQRIPLLHALGRVLAEPVLADRDQPAFARSTRDGFACRAADLASGGKVEVIAQVRAGTAWSPPVQAAQMPTGQAVEIPAGQAVEIMTGAPVPAGADCVVMVEHVARASNAGVSSISLLDGNSVAPGANIVPRAAEARAGDVILPVGTRMAAAQIGAAASCGAATLSVFPLPQVAVLATGDELVEISQQPLPFEIRNSNTYSLAAQIVTAGAEPLRLAIARDDRRHLEERIRDGRDADLLLLSGGVSMGKYDLAEEVLLSLGAEFFFTGALIQPGKPIVFGRFKGDGRSPADRPRYFFGLPGNPISAMVTFSLFVEPFIATLSGRGWQGPRFALAKLRSGVPGKSGLTRFLPAVFHSNSTHSNETPAGRTGTEGAQVTVEPVAWRGSGDLAGASRANCFLVVPAERSSLDVGETVTILL